MIKNNFYYFEINTLMAKRILLNTIILNVFEKIKHVRFQKQYKIHKDEKYDIKFYEPKTRILLNLESRKPLTKFAHKAGSQRNPTRQTWQTEIFVFH